MRLTAQTVESFEDATLNFEQIQSVFSNPQAEPLAYPQLLSAQKQNIQLGHVAAVNADGGGWCNYAFPRAFPTACDGVLAQNGFGGTSGAVFADVQPVDAGHFRAFINGAGLNADAYFIAWGH